MKRIIALLTSPLEPGSARGGRLFFLAASIMLFFLFSPVKTSAHINSLIPSSIIASGPDFTLRIIGTDFDESDTGRVLFDGTRVAATLISSQELRATIPASLIVRPRTVRVALEGFNSVDFTIHPASTCQYSISIGAGDLIGQIFSSDGGTGTINITAISGCTWGALLIQGESFVTLTSVSSESGGSLLNPSAATGSGNGKLGYSVARNSSGVRRSAVIRLYRGDFSVEVNAEPFTVTQEGSQCLASAYGISPLNTVREYEAGAGTIEVTAPRDCEWTASSEQRWIDVTPIVGSGNATISYRVARHEGPPRSGVITIAGKEFFVFQIPSDCFIRTLCAYFPSACRELGEGTLAASRCFRDDVLAKTPRGQWYTKLYYQFSTEAVGILMLNPSLFLSSREVLQRYKPVLDSMIRGEQVTITLGDIEEMESFLSRFERKGSPELREAIKGLREDLRDPELHAEFDVTVTEGPRRDLPAQNKMGRIEQTGMMMAPLALILFRGYRVRPRRKNAKPPRKYLVVTAIALLVIGGPRPVASSQTQTAVLPPNSTKSQHSKTARATGDRSRLPLTFEANQGQADPQVKFISRGEAYNLFLTPTEAAFQLRNAEVGLRIKMLAANPKPKITALDRLPVVSNYFVGNDPAKWRANVSAYAGVKYENVYPGVEMIYYGNQGQLEYDFVVVPGAEPGQIRLGFDGAEGIEIDPSGDLVLRIAGGEVRQRKPVVYQEVNGARQEIPSQYIIRSPQCAIRNHEVGFEIGAYDLTRPLIIDPVLSYSTYFGGAGNEEGNSIAVDPAGNVYVTGFTDSINFPLANASQSNLGGGQQDAFVSKLDPSGRIVYSTYIGGNGQDNGTSIAADGNGNAYITGFTDSTNFPVRNAMQETKRGQFNAFVVKLDPAGSVLNSTFFGGSTSDYGSSIAVDSASNIYLAGIATSADLPMANALQSTHGGLVDMFAAKIDPSGARLLYSTYLGGAGIEGASSIAVDSPGNLYLTGLTSSLDFRTVNALQASHVGGLFDAFVVKLNPSGTEVIYSTFLGGSGEDRAFRIAVDSAGSAYVTGDTDSTNFPLANPAQQTNGGSADAFVAKINASGAALAYSTYLGGSGIDGGTAVAVDSAGGAYVTGFTASTNLPLVAPLQQTFGGGYDGFIAKLSASGAVFDYSTYLGGSGTDSAFGVAADSTGAYVMGVTDSTDFPTAAPFQPVNGGGTADVFVVKIKSSGPSIARAEIQRKHLLVFGSGFDAGAKILIDGQVHRKTRNDEQNPTGMLLGKKGGKKIAAGQTVTLQVRNSDGTLSNEFRFSRL